MPASSLSPKTAMPDCPYAVALSEARHQHLHPQVYYGGGDGSIQSALDDDDTEEHEYGDDLLTATRLNCPAFADAKGCPFKNASSPGQVKETFLRIPTSHYEMSSFMQVLQGLHDASNHTKAMKNHEYQLPGGCPVPESIKSNVAAAGGFRQVLESMSLAAVMARMAEEYEVNDKQQQQQPLPSPSQEFVQPTKQIDAGNEDASKPQLPQQQQPPRNRLSTSLKAGTAVAHEAAENVHFVKNFIRGQIDRHLYRKMILSLYHVYVALEETLEQHGPIHFAPCHFPVELGRTRALWDDVQFWNGDDLDRSALPRPTPATVDYVKRIRHLADQEPLLLLSHSYTRYLGDLSGGKVLARVARRALNLERSPIGGGDAPIEGLAFYHFAAIPSAKLFKDMYRKALDDLPLTAVQIQRLVQEANVAFLLNMRLFEELDVEANVPGAVVRTLDQVLAMGPDAPRYQVDSDAAAVPVPDGGVQGACNVDKCPFLAEKKTLSAPKTVEHVTAVKGAAAVASLKAARCPWPFVVFHDPVQFAKDWQTWVLLGLVLFRIWSVLSR